MFVLKRFPSKKWETVYINIKYKILFFILLYTFMAGSAAYLYFVGAEHLGLIAFTVQSYIILLWYVIAHFTLGTVGAIVFFTQKKSKSLSYKWAIAQRKNVIVAYLYGVVLVLGIFLWLW